MSKSCGSVVAIATQRRRNRQFVAMQVAPKQPRPEALRELYLDAGSRIRRSSSASPTQPSTSR